MPKFAVTIARVEYQSGYVEVEASNEEEAKKKALMSDIQYSCNDADSEMLAD